MYRSPTFYAFLALIIALIVIDLLTPALVCMDGWESQSIGKSGACSHHGGVNNIPVLIGTLASLGIAFCVWRLAKKHERKLKNPENKVIRHVENNSKSLLKIINNILCGIWNFLVKSLQKIGLGKLFDRSPILTVIGGFIFITLLPPLMLALFLLGCFVSYLNGARPETGYLIPNKNNIV